MVRRRETPATDSKSRVGEGQNSALLTREPPNACPKIARSAGFVLDKTVLLLSDYRMHKRVRLYIRAIRA